jgi:hypothetical protein
MANYNAKVVIVKVVILRLTARMKVCTQALKFVPRFESLHPDMNWVPTQVQTCDKPSSALEQHQFSLTSVGINVNFPHL